LSEVKKVPLEEINQISSEVDPAKMLLKLLRLIEKVREEKAV
jgi:hypothetical protein